MEDKHLSINLETKTIFGSAGFIKMENKSKENKPYDEVLGAAQLTKHVQAYSRMFKHVQECSSMIKHVQA